MHICVYVCISTSDHLHDIQFIADACRLWCPLTQQQQPTARPFYFKAKFKITLTYSHTHKNFLVYHIFFMWTTFYVPSYVCEKVEKVLRES